MRLENSDREHNKAKTTLLQAHSSLSLPVRQAHRTSEKVLTLGRYCGRYVVGIVLHHIVPYAALVKGPHYYGRHFSNRARTCQGTVFQLSMQGGTHMRGAMTARLQAEGNPRV